MRAAEDQSWRHAESRIGSTCCSSSARRTAITAASDGPSARDVMASRGHRDEGRPHRQYLGGLGVVVLPNVVLRSEAKRRRRDFNHALGAFLDLVAVNLAAGRGVEGALDTAAGAGQGWAFAEIRRALYRAKINQRSSLTSHNGPICWSGAISG
jgi:hypothetical protein